MYFEQTNCRTKVGFVSMETQTILCKWINFHYALERYKKFKMSSHISCKFPPSVTVLVSHIPCFRSSSSVKSCDSSVGIALGYGLEDRGSRVRFPAGVGNFSLHHRCVQNGSGAQPASYLMGTRGSFPGVKRPEREADHSPPSSAEVKNAWSYTTASPIRLHGVMLS
jgi:hypothetical protein